MSKFKVGDKVLYISKDGEFPVGTRLMVTHVDGSTLLYRVSSEDRVSWAAENDLSSEHTRTAEAIRAAIKALEAELAEVTTFKVGDKVRIDHVGTVVSVGADKLPIRVSFPGFEGLSYPYFPGAVLTKVSPAAK